MNRHQFEDGGYSMEVWRRFTSGDKKSHQAGTQEEKEEGQTRGDCGKKL